MAASCLVHTAPRPRPTLLSGRALLRSRDHVGIALGAVWRELGADALPDQHVGHGRRLVARNGYHDPDTGQRRLGSQLWENGFAYCAQSSGASRSATLAG